MTERGAAIDVPAAVRRKAVTAGAAGWLAGLPGLIADLEREWSVTAGRPYADATEALVLRAELADGTPAVLKLLVPRDGGGLAAREITVLRLAGGRGCAALLRADPARGALLLERLGRSMHELRLPLARRLDLLCAAVMPLWRPAAGCGLPTGSWHGERLARDIVAGWEELGRPCTERAVDYALACARRRVAAHDDERAVLVHGDVHEWNALEPAGERAAAGEFRLVDPDGLLAEAECELGVLMREDPVELRHGDPRERARRLAARCGLDAAAIWEWGAADRLATGLGLTRIGVRPAGREMLATAEYVAAHCPLDG